MSKLSDAYEAETGRKVYMDLMGTACLTIEYVEWLERRIAKMEAEKEKFLKDLIDVLRGDGERT